MMKLLKLPLNRKRLEITNLKKFNLALAGLFAAQAVAIVVLARDRFEGVAATFLTLNPTSDRYESALRHLFDVNLAWVIAVFLVLSALTHVSVATWYRLRYEADVKKSGNKARWLGYALSLSVMTVTVALLNGMRDVSALLMVAVLAILMQLAWRFMEVHNLALKRTGWHGYALGCLAAAALLAVVLVHVTGSHLYGSGAMPWYVYAVDAITVLYFASMATVLYWQYKRRNIWATYVYSDRALALLTLVAQSAIAWAVFAGLLWP